MCGTGAATVPVLQSGEQRALPTKGDSTSHSTTPPAPPHPNAQHTLKPSRQTGPVSAPCCLLQRVHVSIAQVLCCSRVVTCAQVHSTQHTARRAPHPECAGMSALAILQLTALGPQQVATAVNSTRHVHEAGAHAALAAATPAAQSTRVSHVEDRISPATQCTSGLRDCPMLQSLQSHSGGPCSPVSGHCHSSRSMVGCPPSPKSTATHPVKRWAVAAPGLPSTSASLHAQHSCPASAAGAPIPGS